MIKKNVFKNIISLYGLNIAKIVLPLVTLPYLTRVLSLDGYGVVAYVKSLIAYAYIIIDFGFMLSGTKDIVNAGNDKEKTGEEAGNILMARILLAMFAFVLLLIFTFTLPMLANYKLFTILMFLPAFISIFLFDFLFRGIEKMQIITIRFLVAKLISTGFTFVFIHNDSDILWIPLLDILGSLVAVVMTIYQIRKLEIRIKPTSFSNSLFKLKTSAIYFLSNAATTAFSALNTVLIGIFLPAEDVAYWSICLSLVGAVQAMYNPIIDGVFPDMMRTKELNQIKKFLKIFMPIIIAGCIFTLFVAKYALLIVGGAKYIDAAFLLRLLTPVMLFGFPAMLLGWPTLGSINKPKQVTITTICSAIFQILGLGILGITGHFSLVSIAILRGITEVILVSSRLYFCRKYKGEFN